MSQRVVRQQKTAMSSLWRWVDVIQGVALFSAVAMVLSTFVYLLISNS
ncbi:MAG: hypothetical protein H6624_04180 [Bdellovibrionaceae bacterium]|nr:hypothetical protein [Bdellovibrionales bacterium]MCB9083513.1 hypothetical protein [Pseudobdellovibrionaceae bacterium]